MNSDVQISLYRRIRLGSRASDFVVIKEV